MHAVCLDRYQSRRVARPSDTVEPLDAFWHVLNLFWPAASVAALSAASVKFVWHGELRGVRWSRLALWAFAAGSLSLLGGLLLFGRDGRMATYGALVAMTALALWWRGFGPGRR
jgi:hypothetical protein